MKKYMILMLLFSFNNAFSKDFLSDRQAEIVLQEIDSVCGDTWCEGDFAYDFKSFHCAEKTKEYPAFCHLEFEMSVGGESPWKSTYCDFNGYDNFLDLVVIHKYKEGKNSYTLRDEFYSDITENCIAVRESDWD